MLGKGGDITTTLCWKSTVTATLMPLAFILSAPLDLSPRAMIYITSVSAVTPLTGMQTFKDLELGFLQLQYNPEVVAIQINKTKIRLDSDLLQYQSLDKNKIVPLIVTYSPQLEHLVHNISDL